VVHPATDKRRDADQVTWAEHGCGCLPSVFIEQEAAHLTAANHVGGLSRPLGSNDEFAAIEYSSLGTRETSETSPRGPRGNVTFVSRHATHQTSNITVSLHPVYARAGRVSVH
jgi:hypothetical protein